MGVKTKITFNKDAMSNLPVTVPCPNKECGEQVTFKLGDAESKKTIDCSKCGTHIKLSTSS